MPILLGSVYSCPRCVSLPFTYSSVCWFYCSNTLSSSVSLFSLLSLLAVACSPAMYYTPDIPIYDGVCITIILQNARALTLYLYINFTTILDEFQAICDIGCYECGQRADRITTLKSKLNGLNRHSRSCSADDSLMMGNLGGDSGGNIYVRRSVIYHTVGKDTHI